MAKALSVSTDDLDTFLALNGTIDTARGQLMLDLAVDLAMSVAQPLPMAALGIVLACAARAYSNPQMVQQEGAGPFSVTRPFPGIYLTKQERRSLRRICARTGAFTVDPTPVDASPIPSWPLEVWTEGWTGNESPVW